MTNTTEKTTSASRMSHFLSEHESELLSKSVNVEIVDSTGWRPARVVAEIRLVMQHTQKKTGLIRTMTHAFAFELPLSEFWDLGVGNACPILILNNVWTNPTNESEEAE